MATEYKGPKKDKKKKDQTNLAESKEETYYLYAMLWNVTWLDIQEDCG